MLTAPGNQRGVIDPAIGRRYNEGRADFSHAFIGHTNDSHLRNMLVLQQLVFDFCGVAVEATRDKHVFQAISNSNIAVRIECSDVTRVQPAIRINGLSGSLRIIEIAHHHIVATNHDFTGLVRVADATLCIHDGHLNVGDGAPRGVGNDVG